MCPSSYGEAEIKCVALSSEVILLRDRYYPEDQRFLVQDLLFFVFELQTSDSDRYRNLAVLTKAGLAISARHVRLLLSVLLFSSRLHLI